MNRTRGAQAARALGLIDAAALAARITAVERVLNDPAPFARRLARRLGLIQHRARTPSNAAQAMVELLRARWPGNVRQLRNLVRQLVISNRGRPALHLDDALRFEGAHRHPGVEQYLVLEGSLTDGGKTYGAGTWVHHPPGSTHRPSSREGCLLYVTLDLPIELV